MSCPPDYEILAVNGDNVPVEWEMSFSESSTGKKKMRKKVNGQWEECAYFEVSGLTKHRAVKQLAVGKESIAMGWKDERRAYEQEHGEDVMSESSWEAEKQVHVNEWKKTIDTKESDSWGGSSWGEEESTVDLTTILRAQQEEIEDDLTPRTPSPRRPRKPLVKIAKKTARASKRSRSSSLSSQPESQDCILVSNPE
eukprot:TRINITY_DN9395_c0_g1_i1.p1 TRINITY_DN9395_c0_g1~~TRINITY_DN9395_c0_g1_i1.p1  ORF type:complete len:197 (+),score=34.18 TRINITY_DN9395_c0_g1_i1:117-707(+)